MSWCNAGDMVPFIQTEIPKRFALRIRLIETLDGWQALDFALLSFACEAAQNSSRPGGHP